MKKPLNFNKTIQLFFLSIIILFNHDQIHSQIEFAPIGAEWQYDAYFGWLGPGVSHIEVVGDTIINDLEYKIIKDRAITENEEFIGERFVRQNGVDIYEYWNQSGEEIFVFKTYMEVGETIEFPRLFGNSELEVVEVNMLQINGNEVRKHVIQGMRYDVIFETIIYDRFGPEHGMFYDWLGSPSDGDDLYLRCYRDDQIGQVNLFDVDCDEGITNSLHNISSEIRIFPNPASSYLFIDSEAQTIEGDFVTVISISGNKKLIYLNDQKLDISSLQPGMYFGRINDSDKPGFFRFVKY